jgi:hypothetical protein
MAGCGGAVHYGVGSEDLLAEGDLFDRYADFDDLSARAPVPEAQKPCPTGERSLHALGLIEVGPLKLTEVTLEEGTRRIRNAAQGSPPVVIVPDAINAAGGRRVSLEIRGSISLESALARFLKLFDAGLACALQNEALVIFVETSLEPVTTGLLHPAGAREENGEQGRSAVMVSRGLLIVSHTEKIHRLIARFPAEPRS